MTYHGSSLHAPWHTIFPQKKKKQLPDLRPYWKVLGGILNTYDHNQGRELWIQLWLLGGVLKKLESFNLYYLYLEV